MISYSVDFRIGDKEFIFEEKRTNSDYCMLISSIFISLYVILQVTIKFFKNLLLFTL
jgi:hypothetical protein